MGLVDLGEIALTEQIAKVENVVLDLLAGDLLTGRVLTHFHVYLPNY
jgi:hypothetical protein